MTAPDQLARLTAEYDQAAADVSAWLARDDLHQALADDGPVVAAGRFATTLQPLPREQVEALAAHLTVRLAQAQSGDDQVGINRILNAYISFAGAITALIAVPGGAPYVWAYQLRELLDQLTAELGRAEQ